MVANTLHEVTDHFTVEEADWKLHQLNEEVGDKGNIHTCTDMQQYPATDKLNRGLADKKNQLCN